MVFVSLLIMTVIAYTCIAVAVMAVLPEGLAILIQLLGDADATKHICILQPEIVHRNMLRYTSKYVLVRSQSAR